MITLIHGPAELSRAEALAEIRSAIADDPDLAGLNTARLDGRAVTLVELQDACDTMPFLAHRRLVVVEGFLERLTAASRGKAGRPLPEEDGEALAEPPGSVGAGRSPIGALLAYLDRVPETAELVFVEDKVVVGGAVLQRLLELQQAGRARIIACAKPKRGDLPAWIRARAGLRKVRLDAGAVADLAEFVGDDLRQLDQELIKLADYAADGRTVTSADVRRLVPATRAASVFELVDALGSGNTAAAARLMQHSLDADGEPPLRLLSMIGRQYRLLIQAKALQAEGTRPSDIARALNVQDWMASKLLAQASRHSFARLQRAMECVLAADEAIKTGKMGDREAMDVLLAELIET